MPRKAAFSDRDFGLDFNPENDPDFDPDFTLQSERERWGSREPVDAYFDRFLRAGKHRYSDE